MKYLDRYLLEHSRIVDKCAAEYSTRSKGRFVDLVDKRTAKIKPRGKAFKKLILRELQAEALVIVRDLVADTQRRFKFQ